MNNNEISIIKDKRTHIRTLEQQLSPMRVARDQPNKLVRHFKSSELVYTIKGYFDGHGNATLETIVEGGGFSGNSYKDMCDVSHRSKDIQAIQICIESGEILKAAGKFIKELEKSGWEATIEIPDDIGVIWNEDRYEEF